MKTLTVFFTWSNTTRGIAEEIHEKVKGDLYEIKPETPYSKDYNETAYVISKKEADQDLRPALKKPLPDLDQYDRVIAAFPIWWFTNPKIMQTFYESYPDWKGKKLYIFANSYSDIPSQFENAIKDAKRSAKNAEVIPGLYNDQIKNLDQWLKEQGF